MQRGAQLAKIVLATLNSKYIHASFGLRYLFANLDELRADSVLLEFDIQQRALEIVERILVRNPVIVGFGVYIWNARQTRDVVSILKRVRPDITVVLGGPEVSYETEQQEITGLADFVIQGEADIAFRDLCRSLLAGTIPSQKVHVAKLPELNELHSPYDYYDNEDLQQRMIYVEASRGCPFTCEFCLSSLDIPVRQFELEWFLAQLQKLWDRGARQFKFVDRTFNLNIRSSAAIMEFFASRITAGMFVHFEMVPDRLPDALRKLISRFPPGVLQFEVGIQSFNPQVGALISRRQNIEKIEENLRYLRQETGVHVHADLIAGLPGEDLESFAIGFDRLVALDPQEIQVGILKRLRGTPIVRHDDEWKMVYSEQPPYEILQTKLIDYMTMQRVQRFARYWDLVANSGRFARTKQLLWKDSTPFASFMSFSDWLFATTGMRHAIALKSLADFLYRFLTEVLRRDVNEVRECLRSDLERVGVYDLPHVLRSESGSSSSPAARTMPQRQARHLTQ